MMSNIKCTIIEDLLPLYIDEVASEDTNAMVEEHLATCAACQTEYELMKTDLYIPMETNTAVFDKIKRKWSLEKWLTAGVSVFLTVAIVYLAFHYVMHNDSVIAYKEGLIDVELVGQEMLIHYYGESYYGFYGTTSTVMVDGVEKNIWLINLSETIAKSPSRDLFNNNDTDKRESTVIHSLSLNENEKIDAIYYMPEELNKLSSSLGTIAPLPEEAILIWEK